MDKSQYRTLDEKIADTLSNLLSTLQWMKEGKIPMNTRTIYEDESGKLVKDEIIIGEEKINCVDSDQEKTKETAQDKNKPKEEWVKDMETKISVLERERQNAVERMLWDKGADDPIFRPNYYTQYKAIEPFIFLFLNNVPFAEASVCKYVLRWKRKNGIEDLKKAVQILRMMIEVETNREEYVPKKGCL